jgi:hypothetical protein
MPEGARAPSPVLASPSAVGTGGEAKEKALERAGTKLREYQLVTSAQQAVPMPHALEGNTPRRGPDRSPGFSFQGFSLRAKKGTTQ